MDLRYMIIINDIIYMYSGFIMLEIAGCCTLVQVYAYLALIMHENSNNTISYNCISQCASIKYIQYVRRCNYVYKKTTCNYERPVWI